MILPIVLYKQLWEFTDTSDTTAWKMAEINNYIM